MAIKGSEREQKEVGSEGVISAEHRNLVNELNKVKVDPREEEKARAYRAQALENLSSKSGVFRGNPEDIEAEIARIKANEAQSN